MRLAVEKDRLDALENFGGLGGMGTRTDFEIDLGRGDAHLTEENVGERFIVVLAGMNEDRFDFWMALHLPQQRRDFRQVRTRADNIDASQSMRHLCSFSPAQDVSHPP